MIATDHAPHSAEEKSKGLEKSNMGVVGIETAFPIMYTYFVKKEILSLEKLMDLLSTNANKRFGFDSEIAIGKKANLTVFDLNNEYKIDKNEFVSMGKSTPFENLSVFGRCKMTICNGKIVWQEGV
jgi:dihydroorotase